VGLPEDTFKDRATQAVQDFGRPTQDESAEYILGAMRDPTLKPWQVMGLADEVLTPAGLRKLMFSKFILGAIGAIVGLGLGWQLLKRMVDASYRRRYRLPAKLPPLPAGKGRAGMHVQ
jgi:hypothetical protein